MNVNNQGQRIYQRSHTSIDASSNMRQVAPVDEIPSNDRGCLSFNWSTAFRSICSMWITIIWYRLRNVRNTRLKITFELMKILFNRWTLMSYEDVLNKLYLDSLELRCKRSDLVYTYEMIFGFVDVNMHNFFTFYRNGHHDTRGHVYKLSLQYSRLDVRKFLTTY